jgi:hypothetical protein
MLQRQQVISDYIFCDGIFIYVLSPNVSIIIMIKSNRIRWAGNVALIGEKRNTCVVLVGKAIPVTGHGGP